MERHNKAEQPTFTPAISGWIAGGIFSMFLGLLKAFQDKSPGKNDSFYRSLAIQMRLEKVLVTFSDTIPTIPSETAKSLNLRPGVAIVRKHKGQVLQIPSTSLESSAQLLHGPRHLSSSSQYHPLLFKSEKESETDTQQQTFALPGRDRTISQYDESMFSHVTMTGVAGQPLKTIVKSDDELTDPTTSKPVVLTRSSGPPTFRQISHKAQKVLGISHATSSFAPHNPSVAMGLQPITRFVSSQEDPAPTSSVEAEAGSKSQISSAETSV